MTISPVFRAASYAFSLENQKKILESLTALKSLVESKESVRPPMDYLISGLHDLYLSPNAVDLRKHPHAIGQAGEHRPRLMPYPTRIDLFNFRQEITRLKRKVLAPKPWPYSADKLVEYIEALQKGQLVFSRLTKD